MYEEKITQLLQLFLKKTQMLKSVLPAGNKKIMVYRSFYLKVIDLNRISVVGDLPELFSSLTSSASRKARFKTRDHGNSES